jgi:isoquinoline 1-oxidoreductase beta subunit
MSGTFVKQLSRRNFIKNTGVTGVGLWLGLSAKGFAYITSDPASGKNFTPYILVESNNNITLYNIRPEMGQGTFQSVPAVIAEEFEVSLEQVTIRQTNGEKNLVLSKERVEAHP